MTNVKFKQVSTLPATSEKGAVYFTSSGELYLGKSDGGFIPYGNSDLSNLESLVNNNTIDILNLDNRLESLETKPRKASLHCIVSEIIPNSKSGNAQVPYNATITNVNASVDAASGLQLDYIIEKLSGNTWSQIGSSSVLVGQNSRTFSLNVDVNENDWIRVVAQSENEDVQLLTVSLSLFERGV